MMAFKAVSHTRRFEYSLCLSRPCHFILGYSLFPHYCILRFSRWLRFVWLLAFLLLLGGCRCSSNNEADFFNIEYSGQNYQLMGVNFGPFITGQDPNLGDRADASQLTDRMQLIGENAEWLRTYGMSNGLEEAGTIARSLGYKTALGAWIDRDSADNDREIDALITAAQAGEADLLIIGSEVLLRRDATADELISYIDRVKAADTGIPVAYADQHEMLLANPSVIEAVDVVLANYYPYWSGVSIEHAVSAVHAWHQQVIEASAGKQVMVSETGWPDCGDEIGNAVPSPQNASDYFLNFISWARANEVGYFYFEAFDEAWKADYEGPQGACWGIWDTVGNLKPGMHRVFNDLTLADNWSDAGIPCGEGTPSISTLR